MIRPASTHQTRTLLFITDQKGTAQHMKRYYAIIHHDPGSAYGASFPDLPGCFAAADDEEDLMANAIAAVEDFLLDSETAPEGRSLEEVVAEVSDDLKEGAYILSVPYIARPSVTVRANISLDRGLLEAIDAAGKKLGLNRSAFLAQAAIKEIKEMRSS